MLFNSYPFLLAFLPITLLVFFAIARINRQLAALWLFASSVFFYGWWNPAYVGLLLASVLFNYGVGLTLSRDMGRKPRVKKAVLTFGVACNLALLAYYKYAGFFVSNVGALLDDGWRIDPIVLPLGISFFTFTQIAYLVDAYRGEVNEPNLVHYGLFVTYFPHLIAGPVLHHKEMMPQFALPATYRLHWENLSVGLSIFAFGLVKKVVLADGIGPFAAPVFDIAAKGGSLTALEAWGGVLAYTFQIYFDFSGYSDMAIGLSRLFGVKLPLNFHSPYKATNMIEFWRRWHMTLSRFLRDYLYFALGGNRKGPARRYANLLVTMLLGGLWHGAGWTFLIWGGLHGAYLVVNHAWHQIRTSLGHDLKRSSSVGRFAGIVLTFLAVVVGWVFFRADSLGAAIEMLRGMIGANGLTLPGTWYGLFHWRMHELMSSIGIRFGPLPALSDAQPIQLGVWIVLLSALVWLAPNTQQIMADFRPALERAPSTSALKWRPNWIWFGLIGSGLFYALTEMGKVSEFLYFQF